MFKFKVLAVGAAGLFALTLPVVANAAKVLQFPVAAVFLSDPYLNMPTETLTRTLSGNISSFTMNNYVTDAVEQTFSVRFNVIPASGDVGPYSYNATLLTASWDRSAFPFLTFWATYWGGGLTIGSQPGDKGHNLYNLFQANADFGEAQIYSFGDAPSVPEPTTWLMMLVGVAGMGAALRHSKRRVQING